MSETDVLGLLQEHGAVVPGHFQLANGLHTPVYIQTALVLQYPHVAQKVARALLDKFPSNIDVVVTPGFSSLVLGQEVARILKCRAIFAEYQGGALSFRRDFKIARDERALVVEDVVTTGRLTAEVVALTQAFGAHVVGVGAIVDRSDKGLCLAVPMRTLVSYALQVWPSSSCPLCASGDPLADATRLATRSRGED